MGGRIHYMQMEVSAMMGMTQDLAPIFFLIRQAVWEVCLSQINTWQARPVYLIYSLKQ
jgi:hypothetical protein